MGFFSLTLSSKKICAKFISVFLSSLCLIFLLHTSNAWAWSFKGHILIAQMAYEQLPPSQQQQVNLLANDFFAVLPQRRQNQLNHYSGVSTLAKLAVLPDIWRNWKLQSIFRKFNAPLPTALAPYAFKRTAKWHFVNQPYPNSLCHTVQSKNVVWAIATIKTALHETTNARSKTILLIFLAHLTADAHQPLHAISQVNQRCDGDKGGNLFCLSSPSGHYCRNNLHHLWDTGVGFLKGRVNYQKKIERLNRFYVLLTTQNNDNNPMNSLDPNAWVKAELKDADFIYTTPMYSRPNPTYYRQGQAIATRQMYLAAHRLALITSQVE